MKLEENKSGNTNANPQPDAKTEASQTAAKPEAPKTKKKSGFQVALKQVGLALLFLVIGMLAILLALYLPTSNKLKTAQSELDRLVPMETQYVALQQSYAKTEQRALVYKLMSDTSQLKNALDESDTNKTSQSLTYIEEDLSQLDLSQFPDLPTSLNAQFEKIKTSISSKSTSTSSEVDKFYNALLTLSDNLQ